MSPRAATRLADLGIRIGAAISTAKDKQQALQDSDSSDRNTLSDKFGH